MHDGNTKKPTTEQQTEYLAKVKALKQKFKDLEKIKSDIRHEAERLYWEANDTLYWTDRTGMIRGPRKAVVEAVDWVDAVR